MAMRREVGDNKAEGLGGRSVGEEVNGVRGKEVIGKVGALGRWEAGVAGDTDEGFVKPKELGEMLVSVAVIEDSEGRREPFAGGQGVGGVGQDGVGAAVGDIEMGVGAAVIGGEGSAAEAPFTDEGSGVACGGEELSEGGFVGSDRNIGRSVAINRRAADVEAGKEDGARGGADRSTRIEGGEAKALGCEAIEMRGVDEALTVAAEVTVAKVVGDDEDDVGSRSEVGVRWRRGRRRHGESRWGGKEGES